MPAMVLVCPVDQDNHQIVCILQICIPLLLFRELCHLFMHIRGIVVEATFG